jgi:hypothetical protein
MPIRAVLTSQIFTRALLILQLRFEANLRIILMTETLETFVSYDLH